MKNLSRRKQIKLGVILSYGIIIFNIAIGLIYTPWMVRVIGQSNYGLYTLVSSFLNYFIVDFGLWMSINKIISYKRSINDFQGEREVIAVATRIYLALDILVCIAVCTTYFFIDDFFGAKLSPSELHSFKIIYIIAACFGVLSFPFGFIKGIYNAHEYFVENKVFDFLTKTGIIITTIIALLAGGGLFGLVFVYGCVPFIINISRVIYLRKKKIFISVNPWNKRYVKEMLTLSIWLFIIVLAELMINNISPSLIAAFTGVTEVAIFGIGIVIFGYVYQMSSAISGLFLPKVTELYVNKNYSAIRNLSLKVARIQLLIVGFVTMGFAAVGENFIEAWMGKDFSKSYLVAVIMIIPQLLCNLQQVESSNMLAANKIRYNSYFKILTAVFSIIISCIAIPKYGALGSAIAIGFSNIAFMLVGMNLIYKKHLNISYRKLVKGLSPVLAVLISIYFVYFLIDKEIVTNLDSSPWIKVIIGGCFVTLAYVASLPFLLNAEEKSIVNPIIGRVLNIVKK